MDGWERLVLLRHLLDEGLTRPGRHRRATGVSRRVIYYWLESGQLDRDVTAPLPRREQLIGPPKLEPYKAIIQARLASYPEPLAVRLFGECRAAGYTGEPEPAADLRAADAAQMLLPRQLRTLRSPLQLPRAVPSVPPSRNPLLQPSLRRNGELW